MSCVLLSWRENRQVRIALKSPGSGAAKVRGVTPGFKAAAGPARMAAKSCYDDVGCPGTLKALAPQQFLGLYCNWSLPDNANEIADRPVAPKYLANFPKPLLDDLVNGRWLPVLGAGCP